MKTLIIAAADFEIQDTKDSLGDKAEYFICGAGLIESSYNLAKIQSSYDRAFFIGSCGSVSNNIPHLALSTSVSYFPRVNAYYPKCIKKTYHSDTHLRELALSATSNFEVEAGKFYCPSDISTSKDEYKNIEGAIFENIELLSVAHWAHKTNTKWLGICPVTNTIGKDAHQQWSKNKNSRAKIPSIMLENIIF